MAENDGPPADRLARVLAVANMSFIEFAAMAEFSAMGSAPQRVRSRIGQSSREAPRQRKSDPVPYTAGLGSYRNHLAAGRRRAGARTLWLKSLEEVVRYAMRRQESAAAGTVENDLRISGGGRDGASDRSVSGRD